MEVSGKKKSGEWPKSRKGYDRKSNRTKQKKKRGDIEKWDQTDSPEIPDRRKTLEIPGLPSGDMAACMYVHTYIFVISMLIIKCTCTHASQHHKMKREKGA